MKITVLDRASLGKDTPFDVLRELGDVVIYDATAPDEVNERIGDSDVIIVNKIKLTRDVLSNAKKLKLACVFATGYDNIDTKAARELGIGVCNVPAYSTDSVTLLTLSTVLSLAAHLTEYNDFVMSGDYTRSGIPNRLTPVFHEIRGQKWGIIGYGNIGKAVGEVAKAMGAELLVSKRTPIDGVRCVDVDTLCREADIITVHCPLNDSTRGLISKDRLGMMKKNVILVNESRGAVLDEAAVADAIINGTIAAFGCDVYSTEPLPENHPFTRLFGMKNVILTPHAAWGAYEARVRCINVIASNIRAFLHGDVLNRVDLI